ncbi:MAG: DUF3820 family protein [Cytophagales bacterium]
MTNELDPTILTQLVTVKMPFGLHKGLILNQLPVTYLEWLQRKGFPPGKLGMLLATLYEIRLNGLEEILVKTKLNLPENN